MIRNYFGLKAADIPQYIEQYGTNEIIKKEKLTTLKRFLHQFQSPLIYVLLVVAIITLFMKEYADTAVILAVTMFNAIVGFIQETKAENTIDALKNLIKQKATVIRSGETLYIFASEIVPGDIVILDAGDVIPADGVIIEAKNLLVVESQLTGESYPVEKNEIDSKSVESIYNVLGEKTFKQSLNKVSGLVDAFLSKEIDEDNIGYQSTSVATGRAKLFVLKTGMNTRVGKISEAVLSKVREVTPIEKKLKKLTHTIIYIVFICCLIVFLGGIFKGFSTYEIFKIAISLGVSAIPEGLPIVVTLTLAIGAWRMGKSRAIIRNLASASTLAGVNVICTDKTGTITEGKLILNDIITFEEIKEGREAQNLDLKNEFEKQILEYTILCNDAEVSNDDVEIGDPLDISILKAAIINKIKYKGFRENAIRLNEIPFDSAYKYMVTVNQIENKKIMIVKGAPDILIEKCKFKDKSEYEKVINYTERLNKRGLRTILVATKSHENNNLDHSDIQNLEFLGLLEFIDPLREGVADSVEVCKQSGMNVVMITGDHLSTAKYIAQQAGIYDPAIDNAVIGKELDELTPEELITKLNNLKVIARATPEVKMKLIDAFQMRGDVVAMTGDGVNDAPALTSADIGIAMGITGTDVARESADMVLTDDNFTTIVKGVEEARVVFENLKKVIIFLFSTSFGEIITIFLAVFAGYPIPLLAAQILWLNLVTDGFLDIAIATEKKEGHVMKYEPSRYSGKILQLDHYKRIIFLGVVMAIGASTFFVYAKDLYGLDVARTMTLLVMASYQWFNAFNVRSEKLSIFQMNPFGNRALILALIVVVVLQILAIYNDYLQILLRTVAIDPRYWIIAIMIGSSALFADEFRKIYYKLKKNSY
jgi:P-type Ca2+ transporter type 2C